MISAATRPSQNWRLRESKWLTHLSIHARTEWALQMWWSPLQAILWSGAMAIHLFLATPYLHPLLCVCFCLFPSEKVILILFHFLKVYSCYHGSWFSSWRWSPSVKALPTSASPRLRCPQIEISGSQRFHVNLHSPYCCHMHLIEITHSLPIYIEQKLLSVQQNYSDRTEPVGLVTVLIELSTE